MPEEIKLLCNICYSPLKTEEYPDGLYIEPCECVYEELDRRVEDARGEVYNDGYEQGKDDGWEDGRESGYEDARGEFEDEIRELETKLEYYDEQIQEDEYGDRIGA